MRDTVTLLGRELPERLDRRVLVLRPGEQRRVTSQEWSGSFVVLEHGSLHLEDASGRRLTLGQGACLCVPAGVTSIAAGDDGHAVLALVARRAQAVGAI